MIVPTCWRLLRVTDHQRGVGRRAGHQSAPLWAPGEARDGTVARLDQHLDGAGRRPAGDTRRRYRGRYDARSINQHYNNQ